MAAVLFAAPPARAAAPDAPGTPTGVVGDGQVALSWTVPASDGGTAITGYRVQASTDGTSYADQAGCTGLGVVLTCTATGLTNGTSYTFKVAATNGTQGLYSAASSSLMPVGAPTAPQAVVVTGGDGSVTVAWSAPSSNGGSAITGYTATAYDATSGGSSQGSCTTTAATTCTISSLTNGTTHYVEVTATNSLGTGPASTRVSAVAGGTASAPRSVAAVRGDGTITVNWLAPSSDGGSAVTGYIANAYTSTSSSATSVGSCTTTGLECTISGVTNGTVYYVSVAAVTAIRTGSSSSRVTVSAAGAPSAPRSVTATRGDGYAAVSWSVPLSLGGSRISRYLVRAYSAATEGTLVTTCEPTTAKPLSCNIGPLPNGSTYYIDVVAYNAIGLATASEPRVSVTTAATPGVPMNVLAVQVGSRVDVSWRVPAADGGLPISEYIASAHSLQTGGVVLGTCTTKGDLCSITGLKNVPAYVDVVAVTPAGRSQPSSPRVRVLLYDPPDQVQDIAGSPDDRSLEVTWQPPANDGRKAITSYRASAWDAAEAGAEAGDCVVGVNPAKPGPASAGSQSRIGCTIKGLRPGATYFLQVEVTTIVDTVESTPRVAVSLKNGKASVPRRVSLLPGDHLIAVVGSVPATDGGSAITKYLARAWSQQKGGEILAECSRPAKAAESQFACPLSDLDNFEPYWVEVAAVTSLGTGAWTERASMEPQPSAPGAPRGVRVEEREGSLRVSWLPPLFNGGYDVRSYEARAYATDATGAKVSTTPVTQCTVKVPAQSCVLSGFTEGQYLRVDVMAENTVGRGSASAQVDATMVPSVPAAPEKVGAAPSSDGIAVRWSAPVGTGALPILGYRAKAIAPGPQGRVLAACETESTSCRLKVPSDKVALVQVQARNGLGWGDVARVDVGASGVPAQG